MRLSTKGRFAVTAMIDVGLRQHRGPVSLAEIASRHQISLSYLEQMFSKLRLFGLVDSTRGPGGGYSFTRDAQAISVADIIGAVEGETREEVEQSRALAAEDSCAAMTAELWAALNAKMLAHMQSISLQSLIDEQRTREVPTEPQPPNRGIYKRPVAERVRAPNSVFALGGFVLSGQ